MAFSATSASLEGFRLIGRRPFSILVWAIFYALATAAVLALACVLFSPTIVGEVLREHGERGSFTRSHHFEDFNDFAQYFQGLGLAVLGIMAALMVVASIQLSAVYRAVLRPQDRGLAYLRLGGDELRQIGLMLLMFVFFVVVFGGLITGWVWGMIYADLGEGANVALGILGGVIFLVLLILLSVRLSMAAPMTFAERRIRFFGSWGLTRGHFWPLVGMYILAAIFCVIVSLALDAIAQGVAAATGFSFHSLFDGATFAFDIEDFSFEEIAAIAGWGGLAYAAITMLSMAMQMALGYAPQAAAYRDLTAERDPPRPLEFGDTPADPAPGSGSGHDPAGHSDSHDGHGAQAALAGAAVTAGAMGVAAAADHAHAQDHGHAPEPHADHGGHAPADVHAVADPHGGHAAHPAEAHPAPSGGDHGHADHGHQDHGHAAPAADHAADHGAAEHGAADHGHHDHGHHDHGHHDHGHAVHAAAPAADHGHQDHGHAEHPAAPAEDHGHAAPADDHGHADHGHADHGHADHGHAAPAADPHAAHGEEHAAAPHAEPHHPEAAPDPHGEAHPAAPHGGPHHPEPSKDH